MTDELEDISIPVKRDMLELPQWEDTPIGAGQVWVGLSYLGEIRPDRSRRVRQLPHVDANPWSFLMSKRPAAGEAVCSVSGGVERICLPGDVEGLTVTSILSRARSALCGAVLLASASGGFCYERLAAAPVIATPPMDRPSYLQPTTDPVFGTNFVRVTDPGPLFPGGIPCGPAYCRHRYSSTQAWNADESLLAIANGCHGFCFLDGKTYEPAFHRAVIDDCNWSPTDPALMICTRADRIYTWAPRTNEVTTVYAPNDYRNIAFGPYKGNPSRDGSRVVVRATNRAGELVAFAYDLFARKKYPDIDLAKLEGTNGYCGISPTARYIYCHQTLKEGTEVTYIFTLDGVQVQHWTDHHRPGHGDMALDTDGNDVYVGISKADPDKWHIIKRRLEDGVVTDLTPPGYATHASLRSNRPGWVFLSYEGSYSKVIENPGWAPFYREVVALRIDGSGEIRRIAQTRNAKSDYYSETHASPSPTGTRVIWSSNWGEAGGPVADYVSSVVWPRSGPSE